jgi:hypothetical protein
MSICTKTNFVEFLNNCLKTFRQSLSYRPRDNELFYARFGFFGVMIVVFWWIESRSIKCHQQCRLLTRQFFSVFTSVIYMGAATLDRLVKLKSLLCLPRSFRFWCVRTVRVDSLSLQVEDVRRILSFMERLLCFVLGILTMLSPNMQWRRRALL